MEKSHASYYFLMLTFFWNSLGCSSKAQPVTAPQMNESLDIVSAQFDQWKNNGTSFFELLADDVIWTVSGKSPVSGTYHGKMNFLEHAVYPIIQKFKTPLKPQLISLTSDGCYVWLHFKANATTQNDEIYENNYVWKMQLANGKISNCIAFLDTNELTFLMNNDKETVNKTIENTKEYIGMWVTADGYIRHELLPNNRYDEARGNNKSAYQGSYKV